MARLLIVAAAGMGRRLGRDEPKALVTLAGRPLVSWTLDAVRSVLFARSRVAVPPGRENRFEAAIGKRFDNFREAINAVRRKLAQRIVGPAGIAALTGPGVSCDVEEHGLERQWSRAVVK